MGPSEEERKAAEALADYFAMNPELVIAPENLREVAIESERKKARNREIADDDEALFINFRGPKKDSRRISVRGVELIVEKYSKIAAFP